MIGAAVRAGGFAAPRPRAPRVATLAGVAAAHMAALLLMLGAPTREATQAEGRLAVFDVVPPPPPPPVPVPSPAPEPQPVLRPAAASPGGSPGRLRERSAPIVEWPRAPERSAMDATIMLDAPARAPRAVDAGTAALDLGGGGADGAGLGSGSGDGAGDDGGGGGVAYRRVEWIQKPADETWRSVWPRGGDGRLLDGPVFVFLSCYVQVRGQPHRCRVLQSSPDDPRFGRAAVALVARTRVRPVRRNGKAMRGVPVGIPILFDAKGAPVTVAAAATGRTVTAAASAPPAQ